MAAQAPGKIKAATNKRGKQLGCTVGKSYPCGAACFGIAEKCTKTLNQQAAQAASDLMSMLSGNKKKPAQQKQNIKNQVSKPTKNTNTTNTKPTGQFGQQKQHSDPKPKNKTLERPNSLDRPSFQSKKTNKREPNELEKKWHGTVFKDSPDLLKNVVNKVGAPRKISDNELSESSKNTAHYNRALQGMHMAAYKPGETRADTVYRHEFGHFLDHQASIKAREKRAKELGIDLNRITVENINKRDRQILTEAIQLRNSAGGSDLQGAIGLGYISSSKEGIKAFDADEKYLLDRKKNVTNKYLELAKKNGVEKGNSIETIKESKKMVEAEVLKAAKKRNQKVFELADNYFKNKPSIYADAYNEFRKRIEQGSIDRGKDPSLMLNNTKNAPLIAKIMRAAIMEDDEELIEFADRHIQEGGYQLGSDIAGSITANKVSRGHSDEYYSKKGRSSQNTEAFANIVAGYGSGEESFWNKYAKHLSPNGHEFVVKTLKDLSESN